MTAKAVLNIAVEIHNTPAAGLASKYIAEYGNDKAGLMRLSELFAAAAGGSIEGKCLVHMDTSSGTQASSTLTVTQSNATNGDTVTVAGVVFTRQSSPSTDAEDGEFAAITDDDTAAASLKSAIDAHPALKGLVETTRLNNVVTVKSKIKTPAGNSISLATSDATFVAVGAAKLASGATGTVQSNARAYVFGQY